MTVDIKKPYRVRDGREVRFYADDGRLGHEIHGAVKTKEGWVPYFWDKSGFVIDESVPHARDLIEMKRRIHREVWLNIYRVHIKDAYDTKEDANDGALPSRIACIPVTIDYEEGEGW